MVQSTVRYEKLPTDEGDICVNQGDAPNEPGDERNEITICLNTASFRNPEVRRARRKTCFNLVMALILLAVAVGFLLCDWYGCRPEEGHAPNREHSGILQSKKGHSHHHHDGANDDDDDDDEEEQESYEERHHHDYHSQDEHDHNHSDHQDHMHEHTHSSLYHHAVVLTDSAVCSRIGKELLQDGGNVVDAGIASLLCLGVIHPHTSSVGGVFSAIFYNHTSGSTKAIHSTLSKASSSHYGIPASLQGLKLMHSQFGRSDWKKLFQGAIKLAKNGFQVDEILSRVLETHRANILQSKLCELFCNTKGGVKSLGSHATNQNLSELLLNISLNYSNFTESLAMKLAEDLPLLERPDFVRGVRRCGGEINDPFIMEKEKCTIFSPAWPLGGMILSGILDRAREQRLSLYDDRDLNSSASSYIRLLTIAKEVYNKTLATESLSLTELLALNPVSSSHIGVLDHQGDMLVISASLHSSFGATRLLPSSGVILSDLKANSNPEVPLLSFPLLIKLKNDHDDDDEVDHEIQAIAVTGGFSAPIVAAQLLLIKIDQGKSNLEASTSPILRIGMGDSGSLVGCISSVFNGSDVYRLLQEGEGELQGVDECAHSSLSLMLQLHSGHVGAYGAPASKANTDGY